MIFKNINPKIIKPKEIIFGCTGTIGEIFPEEKIKNKKFKYWIYEVENSIKGYLGIQFLEEEIEKTAKTFNIGNKSQRHNLIDALKIAARKFTKEKTGKRPFTTINLVDI